MGALSPFPEIHRYEPLAVDKIVVDGVDPLVDNLARVRAYLEEHP